MTPKPKPQGRPPKLDDRQKGEIGRRLASGEKAADLIRELKKKHGITISRSRFSELFSDKIDGIQQLATELSSIEQKVSSLPLSEQCSIRTLADQMKEIGGNLMRAAGHSSKTVETLSDIASRQALKLNRDDPDMEAVAKISQITFTGNRSSEIAMALATGKQADKGDSSMLTLAELLGG